MTPQEWAACVVVLRATYGASFRLDTEGLLVWFELLADLPGDRALKAVKHLCQTKPAFPSVADIRRLAEPAPADPGDAWRLACDYVSRSSIGPMMRDGELVQVEPLEPWIMSAIESVGRDAIRHRTPDTENTLRAHFTKFYQARLDSERMAASGLRVLDGGKQDAIPAAVKLSQLLPEVMP